MALLEGKEETAVATVSNDVAQHIDTSLSFEEHIKRFKSDIENSRKKNIKSIWEMGAFVNVLKEQKTYGERTVESFIEAMNDIAVSKSEVYKWAQFAERYSVGQVNTLLARNNMGWAVIANLMRVKDVEARTMLEEKVDNGELPASKIQDVVSNLNKQLEGGEPGDKGKTSQKKAGESVNLCTGAFKKMNNFIEKILTSADSCAKDIQDLSAICNDETRYEKAVDVMEEFKEQLPKVRKVLDDIEERLNKAI